MRVLITGAGGFAGGHLARFLADQKNIKVYAVDHRTCDLTDSAATGRLLKRIRPDRIFHLAAASFVPASWQHPREILTNNVSAQINIFESVKKLNLKCRIHVAGSSEEYGKVLPHETPVKETAPLRPLSPYAVSKVAQDLLAYQYHQSFGLDIVRTRAFNHTGPGQREEFVTSNFAKQIALIEAGRQRPVIRVGNLLAIRDFTDVRDIVRAYWLALEKGEAGEVYNVCSGVGRKIREIVRVYLENSSVRIKIKTDRSRMRPSDVPMLVGDASKFKKKTGWRSWISFETTLLDLLNDWRRKIAVG